MTDYSKKHAWGRKGDLYMVNQTAEEMYEEITDDVIRLARISENADRIDPSFYQKYDVKRGLRDLNGKGDRKSVV